MVSLKQVSKFILEDVTLHIPEGETVGIIGATGTGKTTFLKLVCGLLAPNQGEVYTLDKNPVATRTEITRRMGVLFADKPILREEESVADNFKSLQIIHGLPAEIFRREYEELSGRLGFAAWEKQTVKSLSLGQRRRAELAAVLLHHPRLLLLDEPMNGLDADAKEMLSELVTERTKEGMTLLITSHNMEAISKLCNRIVVLNKGKLFYYGREEGLLGKIASTEIMHLKIEGRLPDMTDLPLQRYSIENEQLALTYDSNHISSAEILRTILPQTTIKEVTVRKADLTDAILRIEKGGQYE